MKKIVVFLISIMMFMTLVSCGIEKPDLQPLPQEKTETNDPSQTPELPQEIDPSSRGLIVGNQDFVFGEENETWIW